jgi:hypothetical protein
MSVLVAILIVAGAMAASVALLAAMRRRAPSGGWFRDSGRAASVFEVLGTSFAVLLAFVMFLAFESYNSARQMAGVEAVAVTELYRGATLFDDATQVSSCVTG